MDLALNGKVALVTGGGSGIGAATATVLAQEGCIVYLGDTNVEAAAQVASRLPGSGTRSRSTLATLVTPGGRSSAS